MRIRRANQVIAVGVTAPSALPIVSALISLRYRALQQRIYAAPRIALDMMPHLAHGSDWLSAVASAFAAPGAGRDYAWPPGVSG